MEAESTVRRRLVPGEGRAEGRESPGVENLGVQGEPAAGSVDQIRRVAEEMFSSMCAGFNEDVITEETMEVAMRNLTTAHLNPTQSLFQTQDYALSSGNVKSYIKKILQGVIKSGNDKKVTLEGFVEAAMRYSEGNISLFDLLDDGGVPDDDAEQPDRANLETLLYHPVHTIKLVKRDALRSVERRGLKWLWSAFSTKQLYWLLAVYFLPMMTVQVIVSSVSTALFNAAVVFMVLVTMQIAINSERLQTRMEYVSLFQCFNKTGVQIQLLLPKSDAVHYVTFILGLLVAMLSLGFSNHSFIYYEALVIVSAVVSFLVMMEFDLYESKLFLLLMLAKSLSWVVLVAEKMCSLFPISLPRFLVWLKTPLWTSAWFGFGFVINPLSLLQLTLHVLLIFDQLKRLDWKTFLSVLGPHILFFCWFTLCRYFVSNSSAFHLAIMSTGIVVFPLTTVIFLLSPWFFLWRYGFTPPFFYSLASVSLSGALSAFVAITFKRWRSWWLSLPIEYVVLGLLGLLFGLALFLSAWYGSVFEVTTPLPQVSLDKYKEYCGPENWVGGNTVQTQINCVHLRGRVLGSEGVVESVSVLESVDARANSLKLFPRFLQRAITCHLGSYNPMCGDKEDMVTCVYNGCHFQHDLTYTFKVKLKLPIKGVGATLLVSNHHKEFILNLRSGMSLQFNATFVDGMGSESLTLKAVFLNADGLDDTLSLEKEREEEIKMGMLSTLVGSVKDCVSILLEIFGGYAL